MSKLKNLSLNKKNILIISGIIIVIIIAILAGLIVGENKNKKDVALQEKLSNLIDKSYSIDSFKEDGQDISMTIVADLSKDDLKDLAKEVNNVISDTDYIACTISVFNTSIPNNTDVSAFYTDGLNNRVIVEKEKNRAVIGTMEILPATEKAYQLMPISTNGIEKDNDNEILITLKADFSNLNSSEIVAQMKTYIELFKENNSKTKDSEILLSFNKNESNSYEYNSKFENILNNIENYDF